MPEQMPITQQPRSQRTGVPGFASSRRPFILNQADQITSTICTGLLTCLCSIGCLVLVFSFPSATPPC